MNTVPFHLSITGTVDTEISQAEARTLLVSNLDELVSRATGEGMITGHEEMTLESYSALCHAGDESTYEALKQAANRARVEGFAVVFFKPEELQGVEPTTLQNRLVELGNQAIEDLKE